jgi:carbon starvation protein CstA
LSLTVWLVLLGALAVLLVVDLAIVRARDGEMSLRAAAVASVSWVAIALAFFAVLLAWGDDADASAFLAGYLVEKSLSLDNVFVFLLVFSAFALPVAELVERLYYLKTALAALLVFIGAKMAAGEVWGKIGPEISLPVIAAILATGVLASLVRDRSGAKAADNALLVRVTPDGDRRTADDAP